MPISAHDFALKDMEFTNSEYFELIKHQPGKNNSKYVFLPWMSVKCKLLRVRY